MKRALYINGGQLPVAVGLDGPALRLQQAERADRRAPLRLLSRVVVSGRVEWSMAALFACCDRGVPIAFLRGDGNVRGWCLGDDLAAPEINALLDDATMQADFVGRHGDWLRGLERRAILQTMRAIGVMTQDLRPSEVWTACEERIDRFGAPVSAAHIMRVLGGALAAHVADLLRREKVGVRFVLGHGSPIRLGTDFGHLLIWPLWAVAGGLSRCPRFVHI